MPRMLKKNMPKTNMTPPLWSDPRQVLCKAHNVLLFPGQLCPFCLGEEDAEDESLFAEPPYEY